MVKKITSSKIVSLFLNDYGVRYYLRELADLLGKPHQSLKPYIEELIKESVLIKTQRKNLTEFSLNFKNHKIFDYLAIAEKEIAMEKTKEEAVLRILCEKISPYFSKNTFVIFGSAVKKINKNSDIDLLMVGKANADKIIEEFQKIYNKKIHKIQINSLKELNETLLKEIYKKHLILNNTEQVVRFFGEKYGQNKLV